MATSTYHSTTRTKDRTTWHGGYDHVTRRIARDTPDYMTLIDWWIDLDATPKHERCNFWAGMEEALKDAMARCEMAALGVAS